MLAKRLSAVGTFTNYGTTVTRVEIRERVLRALQRSRVLTPTTSELSGYFERVVEQITSPFSGSGEDDAVSSSSDDELAQTAILFMHYDADGDGLLSHTEFTALIELVSAQTGQAFTSEHILRCFSRADVDASDGIDLNELLLFRQSGSSR